MINAALIIMCSLLGHASHASIVGGEGVLQNESFVQKIPGSLVSFRMIRVPDGSIVLNGRTRRVTDLWVSETEVTWDAYDIYAFRLDLTPEQVAAGVEAESRPSKPYGAVDRGFGRRGYPAIGIAFHGADTFTKWLTRKTGRRYRLPTEYEWEYAARAGARAEPANLDAHAWYWDNADDVTHPVGRKQPNAWGLRDVLGNVEEWTVGTDGRPVTAGGSFMDRRAAVGFSSRDRWQPRWQQSDAHTPKSRWWLSDAPFVGFRVISRGS